ncbi:CD209 antigen-like protein B [Siniperca chuatsi]|uniref:CD209 antigen-like protein B n=1 Tax=Siniperca chuatsi TaxID=119488 RepID=UPI001CE1CB9C|nr:CD209 antigen-like protein B [Siniperca chuatsi]XP_044023644.1 CD209 antigen-like protein B [Siniperca chuatsi]XP_044023645.1 CD209 antigen-like protein B [Siniperca chuatsi]
MISNDENSTNGKSIHHNTGRKGSMCTVRIGARSFPLYPLAIACLGLLNTILMLTAVVIGIYCGKVIEVSTPHQITAQALIIEVKQLQIMQNEAIKAQEETKQALKEELRNRQQLKLHLEQNKTLSDGIQRTLETLQQEKATLKSETSDILESCGRCLPGWVLFNTSCYFHSKSLSSPLKSWSDSRSDCISRGANLTMIDNWEEQLNLYEYLPKLDPSIRPWWIKPGGVWIGLSDIQQEGHWVWLNNVTLLDRGYWIHGEPNNYGAQGEDCAALMNINNPRATWFDGNCQENREWLCEMDPN